MPELIVVQLHEETGVPAVGEGWRQRCRGTDARGWRGGRSNYEALCGQTGRSRNKFRRLEVEHLLSGSLWVETR
jgi:hypothetical protein